MERCGDLPRAFVSLFGCSEGALETWEILMECGLSRDEAVSAAIDALAKLSVAPSREVVVARCRDGRKVVARLVREAGGEYAEFELVG